MVRKKSFVSILELCCYVLLCKTSFRLWWCICDALPLLLLLHSRTHLREQTSWSSRLENSCIKEKLSLDWFQVCVFFLFAGEKNQKNKRIPEEAPVTVCLLCVLEENLSKKKLLTIGKEGRICARIRICGSSSLWILFAREGVGGGCFCLVPCALCFFYVLYNGSWNHGSSSCSRDIHTHRS